MKNLKIIDFRCRPPYKSYLNSYLFKNYDSEGTKLTRARLRRPDSEAARQKDMNLFVQEMDEAGIDMGVAPMRLATEGDNEDLNTLLSEYPGRFIGAIDVTPSDGDICIENIKKYVLNGPCTAVNMELGAKATKEKMCIDDERCDFIYQFCEKNHIPMIVMFGGGNTTKLYPISSLENVMERYPELTLIISHGGYPHFNETAHVATRFPNLYISTDFYMIDFPGYQDMVTAANNILQDQIIFGSAYPIVSMKYAVDRYLEVGLKPEVLPKVMGLNALKALGLDK